MTKRPWLVFLLLSLALSALVYRSALWGGGMLAPLDLGPTLFKHFDHVDPDAGRIPQNHHIIDQFTYDLPLQAAIHRAYAEGEIPWWDPWTYGGRPLLADAHVNGTDPIRLLCYLALPFETAYNWNIILRGMLTGLGMFLLLRHLGVGVAPSVLLGLTYQFAGWFTLFFGHPWIQGAFVYYPFLWMVWMRGCKGRFGLPDAGSAMLCALVYYAGNLQSHTYLPIFALAFLAGTYWGDRVAFRRAMVVVTFGGIAGALLAFPVLANQIEFFLVGERATAPAGNAFLRLLAIPFGLMAVHPWAVGTFRSLDVGKLFGIGGTSFLLFCGGAVLLIGLAGLPRLLKKRGSEGAVVITALLCLVVFFLIIASPLTKLLYPRIAGMAGMAVTVLAGLAIRECADRPLLPMLWARRLAAFHVAWVVLASLVVLAAFPMAKDRIIAKVAVAGERNAGGLGTPEQRLAQVERLPRETTLMNPDAVAGLLASTLALFALGRGGFRGETDKLLLLSLVFGLLATLSFHHRFRPLHDRVLWENLAAGGKAQRAGVAAAAGGLRIDESMLPLDAQVFPHAWAAFHRVHAVQGYSALQPRCLQWYPEGQPAVPADWRADFIGDGQGGFVPTPGTSPARFRNPVSGQAAGIRVLRESHNRLEIELPGTGEAAGFIRTDTRFPGWRAGPVGIEPVEQDYAFTRWTIPARAGGTVVLDYQPTTRRYWLPGISAGCVLVLLCAIAGWRQPATGRNP